MVLTIHSFRLGTGKLQLVVKLPPLGKAAALGRGDTLGLSRVLVMAREIQDRYGRFQARLSALEMSLWRAQIGYSWQPSWHVHLAPRLELAILTGSWPEKPVERPNGYPAEKQPARWNPPFGNVQSVERIVRVLATSQPLVDRLQARAVRSSALVPRSQEQGLARILDDQAAQPDQPAVIRPGRGPSSAAPPMLLRRSSPPAVPASSTPLPPEPGAFPAPPVHPRTGQSSHPPVLRLDQFPAHEINRLTDQVIQSIDRRILAQRERLGRG